MGYSFKTFVANLPRPPTKEQRLAQNGTKNPLKLAAMLSPMQAALFISGLLAWITDAFDFFAVSLTTTRLAAQFHRDVPAITTAITLTLLFRSLGAVVFGLISDRYGRKWPLVFNLVLIAALELGSGFVNTFSQFLAVRSLFGIGMGGIWGMSAATALENMPVECRGLFSGILQQGYAIGYLIAAVVNLTLVDNTNNWRTIFWLGAGLSVFAAVVRAILPESEFFLRSRAAGSSGNKSKTFLRETKEALKIYWLRAIYAILLMTGFNFFSHGSQDLYPTYLEQAKDFTKDAASKATIIGNCGAVTGGLFYGYFSQYLGRRLTIIIACLWTACFIPLWIIPYGFSKLSAGAFFVQVGVQGAWGVIPVYLNELSPPQFRAVFPGLAYQLGNMVSSASAQIEATAGKHLRTFYRGENRPDYGKIQGILIGVVAAWIILLCLIGPEDHSSHFESAHDATVEGAVNEKVPVNGDNKSDSDKASHEKVERV